MNNYKKIKYKKFFNILKFYKKSFYKNKMLTSLIFNL